jgi:hypothetical protein
MGDTVVACVHVLDGTAKNFERNDEGDCVCDDCIRECMARDERGDHDPSFALENFRAVCPDCLEKSLRLAEYTDG